MSIRTTSRLQSTIIYKLHARHVLSPIRSSYLVHESAFANFGKPLTDAEIHAAVPLCVPSFPRGRACARSNEPWARLLSCRADSMGGKNSVNNRCRIAKHFRPKWNRSCAYFIGTSSHCVFSNTIQNLPCSGPRTRSRWVYQDRM